MTPLHYAANNNHLNVVKYLSSFGADFSEKINNESVLHWVERKGYYNVVQSIFNHTIDINSRDSQVGFLFLIILLFILLLD